MIREVVKGKVASLKGCFKRFLADLYFYFCLQLLEVRRNFIATDDLAQERIVGLLALRDIDAAVKLVSFLLGREHDVDEQLANNLVLLLH